MSEGTDLRADIEEALFGGPGEDPLGAPVLRVRDRYRDDNGNWVNREEVPTRAFLIATQPSSPYAIAEVGMSNIKNAEPTAIILPFSGGEPRETDKIYALRWTWKMSNLIPVVVGGSNNPGEIGDIVYYQAEIVRSDRTGSN